MHRAVTIAASILIMLGAGGCASSSFTPSATHFGAAKSAKDVVNRASDMRYAEAEDVEVLVGKLPDGVTIEHEKVEVDPRRFEVLGTAKATSRGADFFQIWFYPYDESESWRKGFCYWQVPLTWVTLGIWSFISPLSYPCKVLETSSESGVEERKERIVGTLRKTAKAMGGSVVIVTSLGSTRLVEVGSGTTLSTTEATQGEGLVLRRK